MKSKWLKIVALFIFLILFVFVTGKLFFEKSFDRFFARITNVGRRIEAPAGTLRVGLASELQTLDPTTKEVQNREWLIHLYEGLVRTDENLKIEPGLAIAYGAIDDLTWEFRLRPEVVFHDGSKVTFDDIFESVQAVNEPTIESIEKIDEERFYIKTKTIDPLLLQKLASIFVFPKHAQSTLLTKPVGTGPYRFESLQNGVMRLARFESYWGVQPFFPKVELKLVKGRAERIKTLEDNSVHLLTHVPPEIVPEFFYEPFELVTHPTLEANFLLFGFRGPFQNKKLREAAMLAFDRTEVTKLAFGFARSANQYVGNGIFGFHPSLQLPGLDPKRSLELVEGVTSSRIKISIDLPAGFTALAEFLKDKLKRVGFDPEINLLAAAELQEKILSGKSDLYFFGWRSELGDASAFLNDVIHTKNRGYGEFNGSDYSNSEVDRLIEESNKLLSPLERLEKLRQAMKIITEEDMVGIPLFIPEILYAVNKEIQWFPRFDGYVFASEITQK